MAFARSSGFASGLANGFAERFAAFRSFATPHYDGPSQRAALDRLDGLATLFDTAIVVPGTNIRFGVEALLRLWPGVGDAAASALSFYLLYEASRLGVPRLVLARMLANVVLEGAVGAVPIAGDAFDVFFRANRRNIAILRAHFARTGYAWRFRWVPRKRLRHSRRHRRGFSGSYSGSNLRAAQKAGGR